MFLTVSVFLNPFTTIFLVILRPFRNIGGFDTAISRCNNILLLPWHIVVLGLHFALRTTPGARGKYAKSPYLASIPGLD